MSTGAKPPPRRPRAHAPSRAVHVSVTDHRDKDFVREGTFSHSPIRIGRRRGSDIELPFSFVSSSQAEIVVDPLGKIYIQDLGSQNQLVVASRPLPKGGRAELGPDAEVTLGPLRITVQVVDKVSAVTTGELPDDDDMPAGRAHDTVGRLRASFEAFSASRQKWLADLSDALSEGDEITRSLTRQLIMEEFPRDDWESVVSPEHHLNTDPLHDAVTEILGELAPRLPPPPTSDQAARTLARAMRTLRLFTSTLAAVRQSVRRGMKLLGSDASLPGASGLDDPPADLLVQTLDWRHTGDSREKELQNDLRSLPQDIEALSSATMEALHDLVMSLSPPVVERNTHSSWPTRNAALWRSFSESFHALAGEGGHGIAPAFQRLFAASLARVRERNSSGGSR